MKRISSSQRLFAPSARKPMRAVEVTERHVIIRAVAVTRRQRSLPQQKSIRGVKKNMPFKQLGIMELVIILVIVILIFGVGRLGKLGKDLGEGIREFRRGVSTGEGENKAEETKEETEEKTTC